MQSQKKLLANADRARVHYFRPPACCYALVICGRCKDVVMRANRRNSCSWTREGGRFSDGYKTALSPRKAKGKTTMPSRRRAGQR